MAGGSPGVGWPAVAWPGGTTHVAAIIGDPVHHSLSPALHNAAFAALGVDWVYVALPVASGRVAEAIAGVRALGIAGLSVTMPHKPAVAAEVDQLTPIAQQLGAVNTVVRRGAGLLGDSTDGAGFLAALRTDEGWDAQGRHCLVIGTGGAARAVVLALATAGAASVSVVGRRPAATEAAAALAGGAGRVADIEAAEGAELIVNATPVGMSGRTHPADSVVVPLAGGLTQATEGGAGGGAPSGLPLGLEPAWMGAGQLVVDLIYAPPSTPLLDAARRAGAQAVNGLGMLIHQAALQSRLWTGMEPPLEAMSAAALGALSGRGGSGS